MLIGIDASRSNVAQKTGTEYYSFEIIKEIIKISKDQLRLYSKTPLDYIGKQSNVENRAMPFPKLWSQVRLSYELVKNPVDVLFEPAHTIPVLHSKRIVVTLHDVGFRHFPELYTPLERIYHNWAMKFSVRHATKIISISDATTKDLVRFYNADPKKITVIYHGYDKDKYFQLRSSEKTPDKIAKLGSYIYFIGRLEAKKNVKTLIKAFGELKKDNNVDLKLVLAGRPGYQYEQIKDEMDRLPSEIRSQIIEPGYIPDEDVAAYMRNAKVFAFQSYFEGFGMPLVEAMASGVPVVASNVTSIPEITGEAGLLFAPDDYKTMAKCLHEAVYNQKTRADLIKKGLERVKIFDWQDCAKKTLEVIKSAADH